MKPLIILLLAVLEESASGQILFSNRVTGETGYVTNVDEYFQDARVVATNANNKFGGDGSLLTGLTASQIPTLTLSKISDAANQTNDLNTVLRALFPWLSGTNTFTGTNSFAKPVTVDNLTSTNGFTNQSLTANTAIISDANKKTVSLANGGANTILHGTTPPAYSNVANADLANSSITVSGGGGVGISGSPVSLGGTVTVGATTDQRQMGSLGLGVAASATPGTVIATNWVVIGTNVAAGSTNILEVWGTNTIRPAFHVIQTNGPMEVIAGGVNGLEVKNAGTSKFTLDGSGNLTAQGNGSLIGNLNVGNSSGYSLGSQQFASYALSSTMNFGSGWQQITLLPTVQVNVKTITAFSNGVAFVSGAATAQYLTNIVYTNVSLDFPSTAAGASSDMIVTISNLKSNDFCYVNPAGSVTANGTVYTGWISNTTCYVRLNNYNTVASSDPAAQNFQVKVEQWK